jgi:hypothetical protein
MPRLRFLLGAVICCAIASVVTGAGASASVAPGTLAIKVLAADIQPPIRVPTACAGMTFAWTVVGTDADDVIPAANGAALIFGNGGNDTIEGGNGADCIVGGEGNDVIYGGNGSDVLFGGPGDDTIDGGNGGDLIDGGEGVDTCEGGNGPDEISGCEKEPANARRPDAQPDDNLPPTQPVTGGAVRGTPAAPPSPNDPRLDRADLLEPCPDDADCVVYIVRRGDNLVSIVRFFEVSLEETRALNPWLEDAAHLPVGVELRLPWPDWLPDRPGHGNDVPSLPVDGPTSQPNMEPPGTPPTPDPTPEPTPAMPEPTPHPAPDPTPAPTPSPSVDPTEEPRPTG